MFLDETRYIRICNITYLFEWGGGGEPAFSPTSTPIQTREKEKKKGKGKYMSIKQFEKLFSDVSGPTLFLFTTPASTALQMSGRDQRAR